MLGNPRRGGHTTYCCLFDHPCTRYVAVPNISPQLVRKAGNLGGSLAMYHVLVRAEAMRRKAEVWKTTLSDGYQGSSSLRSIS